MDRDHTLGPGGEHQANYRHLYSTLCIFRNDDCRNSLAALSYDVSSLLIPIAPTFLSPSSVSVFLISSISI